MEQNHPVLISVLMAVYNTPFDLVKRAIDSVLCQDFQDFELIILDDGSHAQLGEEILRYSQQYESKITYVRHQNCGQAQAINRGASYCRGAYITIIDSDDEYKPSHLSACLHQMPHADLICSLTETIVNSEEDYYVPDRHDLSKNIRVDDCTLFATFFGRKEVFNHLSFQNIYAADADFYARAATKYRVKKVDLRTYIYYRNITSSVCAVLKQAQLALV